MSDFQVQFPETDNQPDPNPQDNQQSQEFQQPEFESVATGFLKDVAEQDRAIVEKYVKEWDSGVTTRFKEMHDKYQPYESLVQAGDLDHIQKAIILQNMIDEDPVAFLERFQGAIEQLRADGVLEMAQYEDDNEELGNDPALGQQQQQQDDPRDARIQQLETMLETLNNNFQQDQQSRQEAKMEQDLDNLLAQMHNTYGPFDDRFILAQLAGEQTPQQAWANYQETLNSMIGSRRTPPPMLTGSGGYPGGQVDPSKLTSKDRIAYITALAQAQNQD